MKKFLCSLIVLITLSSIAQSDSLKKNTLSFESGLNFHGIFGLSYYREIKLAKNVSFEAGIGLGLGNRALKIEALEFYEKHEFLVFGGFHFKFGKNEFKPLIGFDLKAIRNLDAFHESSISNNSQWIPENTVSYNLYSGCSYKGPYGFALKLLVGMTTLPRYVKNRQSLKLGTKPTLGISFGYTF